MKKLHLVCSPNPEEALSWIKITPKRAFASNGIALLILPTEDVLPGILIDDDVLFIRGTDWHAQKMYKAKSFRFVIGGLIAALDKEGNALGTVKGYRETDTSANYPDLSALMPETFDTEVSEFIFEAEQIARLCKAAGYHEARIRFAGYDKFSKVDFYRNNVLQENPDIVAGLMIFENQFKPE